MCLNTFLAKTIIAIGGHQMIFFLINNSFQLFNALQAFLFNGPPTVYEIGIVNSFVTILHNSMT
jgi:hypothetical protein